MMRKMLSLILAGSLLLLSACKGNADTEGTGLEAVSQLPAVQAASEGSFTNEGVTNEVRDPIAASYDSFDSAENAVLLDDEYVYVEVQDIAGDQYDTYTVSLKLQNKQDRMLAVYADNAYVNGTDLSADSWFYEEIEAGAEKLLELTFPHELLEKTGIGELRRVEIYVVVGDAETGHELEKKGFTIYPDGKEEGMKPLYEVKDSDIVLIDNEDISIYITGFGGEASRTCLDGYMVNHSSRYTSVTFDENTTGGTTLRTYGGTEVFPNSEAFFHIYWDDASGASGAVKNEGQESSMFLYASDYESYEDLWEETVTYTLPDGFAAYLAQKPAEKESVWIPGAVTSASSKTSSGNPYDSGMAGIQIGELVVEVPMDMFGRIEEISGDSMSFYREDSYILFNIEEASGQNGSLAGDPDAFAEKVAAEIGSASEWTASQTTILGNSAAEVRFRNISTAQIDSLDLDLVAFNYNGMFYAFGIGVLDHSYDIEAAFARLENSITAM